MGTTPGTTVDADDEVARRLRRVVWVEWRIDR
jgi:hypothetical protein